ncbi:MAG: GldG family protein [Ruminococcus sp.]|nr:GldG family protein [Ruminococcus sp.]
MSEENKKDMQGGESEYIESKPAADILADVISGEKNEDKTADPEKKESAADPEDEEKPKKAKKSREHKKLKHGAMSTVYTVIFVAVVVMVNIIAGIILKRHPITFDLTKNNKYSISEQSEKYIESIDCDVKIRVFAEEDSFVAVNDYTKQANEVIKRCCQKNKHISVEYIDIDKNPDIVSDYADQNISQYSILAESPSLDENGKQMKDSNGKPLKRIRTISLMDLISFKSEFETQVQQGYGMSASDYILAMCGNNETYAFAQAVQSGYAEASTADQAFLSALMAVSDPDPVVVSVLTGRNESADLSYLRKLLLANGYSVNDVNITAEDIPEDTDLCVIPAPSSDYMEAEITKVDEFVNNGGNMGKHLMYIASYNQQSTPNLDEFLEEYYISVGEGVVCENDPEHYYTQSFYTIADDISESFADDIDVSNSKLIIRGSRPVKLLAEGEKGKMNIEAYVKSTADAYVADLQTGEAIENGQQVYAAMSSKVAFTDDGGAVYSNVFVIGGDSMVGSSELMYNQFQNRTYILSVLNGMTGKTSTGITVEPKVITGNIFDITAEQIKLLKIVFIGLIPLATLAAGLVIWLRRKNR